MRRWANERAKEPAEGLKRGQVLAKRGRTALEKKDAKGHKQRRIQTERAKESKRVTGRRGKIAGEGVPLSSRKFPGMRRRGI
jgi:hypothetical protein